MEPNVVYFVRFFTNKHLKCKPIMIEQFSINSREKQLLTPCHSACFEAIVLPRRLENLEH